jgi:ribosomal protein S30
MTSKEYNKVRNQTPERKAYMKERAKNPKRIAYMKTYEQTVGKAVRRDYRLISKYGKTLDEYNAMWFSQNGCCKICEKHQLALPKALAVDHDHITGVVRGLLCIKCNDMLGRAYDNPQILLAGAKYLKDQTK